MHGFPFGQQGGGGGGAQENVFVFQHGNGQFSFQFNAGGARGPFHNNGMAEPYWMQIARMVVSIIFQFGPLLVVLYIFTACIGTADDPADEGRRARTRNKEREQKVASSKQSRHSKSLHLEKLGTEDLSKKGMIVLAVDANDAVAVTVCQLLSSTKFKQDQQLLFRVGAINTNNYSASGKEENNDDDEDDEETRNNKSRRQGIRVVAVSKAGTRWTAFKNENVGEGERATQEDDDDEEEEKDDEDLNAPEDEAKLARKIERWIVRLLGGEVVWTSYIKVPIPLL